VGLGGGEEGSTKEGAFLIVNTSNMEICHEGRDCDKALTVARYSPDGSTLALAGVDSNIYLYDTANHYSLRTVCRKHSNPVLHLDFSVDGSWIQSNCAGYELLYFDSNTGNPHPATGNIRDVEWATFTCTLGWPMQGLWSSEGVLGGEAPVVKSADRSPFQMLLTSGDNQGCVQLMHYPALSANNGSLRGTGHGGPISCTRLAMDDSYVVSTGRKDRGVFQWRLDLFDQEDDEEGAAGDGETKD
jgi:WD40 repeat protein